MLVEDLYKGKTLREAFTASTDGPNCPISECYTPEQFIALANAAGLRCELSGVAVAAWERISGEALGRAFGSPISL